MPRFNPTQPTAPISNDSPDPEAYRQSADFLESRLSVKPEILIVLGSGLGSLADELENKETLEFDKIPHFKTATAPGHKGRLVAGRLKGRNVLAMQGRFHVYEGHSPLESAFPIRVASLLGVDKLLTTCACGGVNEKYKVGDITLINDYINFTHTSPLVGMSVAGFDSRFIDVSTAFDKKYREMAVSAAKNGNIPLQKGVYFYMPGPQFETPAEIRAIRALGGDLVGMSLVHEVIMARRMNMRTLALGLVTNMAAGILDAPLTEEEVLVEGKKAAVRFSKLVKALIEKM